MASSFCRTGRCTSTIQSWGNVWTTELSETAQAVADDLKIRVDKIESNYGIGGAKKHVGVIVMPGQNAELLQKEKLKELGGELEDYQWTIIMVNCPDKKQAEPENSDESGD